MACPLNLYMMPHLLLPQQQIGRVWGSLKIKEWLNCTITSRLKVHSAVQGTVFSRILVLQFNGSTPIKPILHSSPLLPSDTLSSLTNLNYILPLFPSDTLSSLTNLILSSSCLILSASILAFSALLAAFLLIKIGGQIRVPY